MRLAEVNREESVVEQRNRVLDENMRRLDRRIADVVATGPAARCSELVLHPGLQTEQRLDAVGRRSECHRIDSSIVQGPDSADHRHADGSGRAETAAWRNGALEADLDRSSRRGCRGGHRQERVGGGQRVSHIDDRVESEFVDDDPGVVCRQVDHSDSHLHPGLDGDAGDGSAHSEPRVGPPADVSGSDGSADGDRALCLAQRPARETTVGSEGDTAVQSYRSVPGTGVPSAGDTGSWVAGRKQSLASRAAVA